MRWRGRRQSENVEDRRGARPGVALGGGGLLVVLVAVVVIQLMGGDPSALLDTVEGGGVGAGRGGSAPASAAQEERADFVGVVLGDTEDVWNQLFADQGLSYREPGLRLFTQGTRSGCGFASSAVGPFYCPADEFVYIDLGFFEELSRRFGAPGDFAQAYVVAHEVGHHVQRLLGFSEQVDRARAEGASERVQNQLSVRLELQADFLAGVFAHYVERAGYLERGDIDEALGAANAIGDDRLQQRSQGTVVPDSFTHGSSEQRMAWFELGYETGDLSLMDTFDDAHFAEVGRGR